MFFDDRKKSLMTIMGKRSAKGERTAEPTPMKPEVVMNEGGEADGRHVAAQDMIAAMQSGSAMRLSDAMNNWMSIHMARRDESDVPAAPKE